MCLIVFPLLWKPMIYHDFLSFCVNLMCNVLISNQLQLISGFQNNENTISTSKISWFDFITLHIWLMQKLKKTWYIIGIQINWNRVKHFQNQLIWYYHITHQINAKTQKIIINHWFKINENTIKHIKIIWLDIITLHSR